MEKNMEKDLLFLTGSENFRTIIEKNAYYVDCLPPDKWPHRTNIVAT